MKKLYLILTIIVLISLGTDCNRGKQKVNYRVGQKFNYDSLIQALPCITVKLDFQNQEFAKYYIHGCDLINIWITVNNDSTITSIFQY